MTTREDFETRFTQMGRDIDEMLSDDREEYREERRELKDRWDRLEQRRMEMNAKGDSAWEEFKDEMEDGWNNIKDSFDDLRRRLSR
jgi:phage-related minor tail protein